MAQPQKFTTADETTLSRKRTSRLAGVFGILFVLVILAVFAALFVFRNVLTPGQQVRVIDMAPFMSAFVVRTDPNTTVPTVNAPTNANGLNATDLLNMDFSATEEVSATEEATAAPLEASYAPLNYALTIGTGSGIPGLDFQAQTDSTQTATITPPSYASLSGIQPIRQGWNNCGPANITMALSYFGWQEDQSFAAGILKPESEDKNVSPSEMVSFVRDNTQILALSRMGGDALLLKQLISSNFPVIIETGYAPEGNDWLGHYQTVVGYDDFAQNFYVYDSYLGTGENGNGLPKNYETFDREWQSFNRLFIVLYLPEREGELQALLGERADVQRSAEMALEVAQLEARENPRNQFAWFNIGTSLAKMGRFDEASLAYDNARNLGLNFRMLWYQFGPFEAYYNSGRYEDVLSLADSTLNTTTYVEEVYYWQGRVFEAQGQTSQAANAYQQALLRNPNFTAAQDALSALA